MNPTSLSLLQTIAATDSTLSPGQKSLLHDVISGRSASPAPRDAHPLLLTQKEAAKLLSVSRVTLWRMTRDGVFNPIEILPGTFRYRFNEVEAVARLGKNSVLETQKN